jgi:hypothetical protein
MDGRFINQVRGGRPTRLLAMAEIAYCYQHVSMWDGETLVALFRETGFADAGVHLSGDSRLEPPPDTDYREPETVYVEGLVRAVDETATRTAADDHAQTEERTAQEIVA